MTNDQAPMTKQTQMTNEVRHAMVRHIGHWCLVIGALSGQSVARKRGGRYNGGVTYF
jgi:hypothetical protein